MSEVKMAHPEHTNLDRRSGMPAKPVEPSDLLLRWRLRRECRKSGGHWWHPEGAMIDWFCCVCGKETDGMPQDGSSR